jgi:hypothetical protein
MGTPAEAAIWRALSLRPIMRIVSGLGPMKVKPALRQASAKSALSARKP